VNGLYIKIYTVKVLGDHVTLNDMAGPPGFEPGQKDPKSFVLPLHNGPPVIVIIALRECDWQCCRYLIKVCGGVGTNRYQLTAIR
jgi:hypothetical protein